MRTTGLLALIIAASAPAAAAAQPIAPSAAARNVVIEVREEGRLVASSTARLQPGRPAAIPMDGPFAMRLRIDAVEGAGYHVRPHLTAQSPSGWTKLPSPALTVAQGQVGKATVRRASGPPLELAVTVN